jgi:hypothetical protein
MLLATFRPTTGWAGKEVDYEDGRYTLQGFGPITIQTVLDYDRQGHLEWSSEGLRDWVLAQVPTGHVQPLGGGQTPPRQRRGMPAWAIVLIAVGVLILVLVGVVAAIVVPTQLGQNDEDREVAVKEGIHSIQSGVRSWAADNADEYPDPLLVSAFGLWDYVDEWPRNPYTNQPMSAGTEPGQFTYELAADHGFVLIGYGEDGPVITVP